MRFSEFQVTPYKFIDFGEKWIQEMDHEDAKSALSESESDVNNVNEIIKFIGQYNTDPSSLVVGDYYFAMSLIARPHANSIRIEYTDKPVVYLGVAGDSFVFETREASRRFQIPINYVDLEHEYGPRVINTIVYTSIDDCNQFLTHVGLQFTGRWKIKQEKISL